MSVLKTYLAAGLIVLVIFAIGLALWGVAGISKVEASLAVACLLLGASQFAAIFVRDSSRERTAARIDELTEAGAGAKGQIEALRGELAELRAKTADAGSKAIEELASQVQVLETLVKQLAEEVSHATREGAAPAAGTVAVAPANGNGASGNGAEATRAQLVEKVRRSLENNRVDLYLQPVVTLPQRKTRYYEALTRLRDAEGGVIMPSSYLEAAEHAGIMPMIDNLLLFRCVRVMRRLIERNRDIGVFCNISAHSLLDAEFFPHFLEFMQQNQELAGSLMFEFAQSTVEEAGPLERESMSLLREMGFRFSMDHVTRLGIDFPSLADRGFAFVKVDAHTLIDGAHSAGAQIHSADLKALAGRYGVQVIAEKIENERQAVTLLDYHIALGQGFLFSEPRLVREEIIDTSREAMRSRAI